jgi:hypothetical protein
VSFDKRRKLRTQRRVSGGLGVVVDQHIKFKVATAENRQVGEKKVAQARAHSPDGVIDHLYRVTNWSPTVFLRMLLHIGQRVLLAMLRYQGSSVDPAANLKKMSRASIEDEQS